MMPATSGSDPSPQHRESPETDRISMSVALVPTRFWGVQYNWCRHQVHCQAIFEPWRRTISIHRNPLSNRPKMVIIPEDSGVNAMETQDQLNDHAGRRDQLRRPVLLPPWVLARGWRSSSRVIVIHDAGWSFCRVLLAGRAGCPKRCASRTSDAQAGFRG